MCGCFFRVAAVFFPNKKPTLQLVQSRFETLCFLFNFPRQLVPRTISELVSFSSFQMICYRPFTIFFLISQLLPYEPYVGTDPQPSPSQPHTLHLPNISNPSPALHCRSWHIPHVSYNITDMHCIVPKGTSSLSFGASLTSVHLKPMFTIPLQGACCRAQRIQDACWGRWGGSHGSGLTLKYSTTMSIIVGEHILNLPSFMWVRRHKAFNMNE